MATRNSASARLKTALLLVVTAGFVYSSIGLFAELISARPMNQVKNPTSLSAKLNYDDVIGRLKLSNSLSVNNIAYPLNKVVFNLQSKPVLSVEALKSEYLSLDNIKNQKPTHFLTHCYAAVIASEIYSISPSTESLDWLQKNVRNAIGLSAYEAQSQQILIPILIKQWDNFDNPTKYLAKRMIRHAFLKHQSINSQMISDVVKYDLVREFLPLTQHQWQIKKLNDEYQKQNG